MLVTHMREHGESGAGREHCGIPAWGRPNTALSPGLWEVAPVPRHQGTWELTGKGRHQGCGGPASGLARKASLRRRSWGHSQVGGLPVRPQVGVGRGGEGCEKGRTEGPGGAGSFPQQLSESWDYTPQGEMRVTSGPRARDACAHVHTHE